MKIISVSSLIFLALTSYSQACWVEDSSSKPDDTYFRCMLKCDQNHDRYSPAWIACALGNTRHVSQFDKM